MEGKGMTAEQSSSPGENGEQGETEELGEAGAQAHGSELAAERGADFAVPGEEPDAPTPPTPPSPGEAAAGSAWDAPDGPGEAWGAPDEPDEPDGPDEDEEAGDPQWEPPRVRVDARLLEATLLNLHKRIAAVPLVFDIPGTDEVTTERAKLLSQIDDYLLPRVRESAAPLLVALVGSTGAGKSTLVNSIVGTQVSLTGVRRPTTNSPVLACHPDDIHWFAENMFLPTLPRVRQEGLARPGRDGLLVLAASEGMTKGIALLDTPDIDSVVRAHYDFAYQFLDASDLWLFMTSASRYADAPVWELLQHARDRGAALGIVLSRVPPSHRTELISHFTAMLDANGVQAENRFVIPETGIVDGVLPDDIFQPIRDWLNETAQRTDRRVAVLGKTMSGMLDTFKLRVPRLAAHVDAQVVLRTRLRREAETSYATALETFDDGTHAGHLLVGEVQARWQDYAASGDLGTALRGKRTKRGAAGTRRGGKRERTDATTTRYAALEAALRAALEALVVSVADRAAEQVTRVWRDNPGGAALLAAAEESRVRDERAKREFELAFGTQGDRPASATTRQGAFDRSSPDLPLRVSRAVSAWQDQLMRLMQSDVTRWQGGAAVHDIAPVSVVTLIAMLGAPSAVGAFAPAPRETAQEGKDGIGAVPREVLDSIIGDSEAEALMARARQDLRQRIGLLLDEEMLRFGEVLDEAGEVDPVAAVRLYQAEYSLEAAR
jgi:energy-coupling factor transporter ATP-binding protein EcfA2